MMHPVRLGVLLPTIICFARFSNMFYRQLFSAFYSRNEIERKRATNNAPEDFIIAPLFWGV